MSTSGSADPTADGFLTKLAGFFAFLRTRGLAVGTSSELDLGHALRHVPILDRDAVLGACRVTLAKSPRDVAVLEEAFELYWSEPLLASSFLPSQGGAVPRSPPRNGRSTAEGSSPPPMDSATPIGAIQIGIYSPDAPAVGHPLPTVDARRLARFASAARRFRRFAASLPGRRFETARRGDVDFRATARRSLRQGAEWIELRHRHRRASRAELFVLWDVSGSMRDHDGELFALVHALLRASRRTRVFAFSTDLVELTALLRARPYARARHAASRALGPASGGTRIGRCLRDFRRAYGGHLHAWTTLVVLSDGWDLGDLDLLASELDGLRRRVRRIVWINPYGNTPGFEPATAGMQGALPFLDALLGPDDLGAVDAFRPRSRTMLGKTFIHTS
jgi:hypothetical protein